MRRTRLFMLLMPSKRSGAFKVHAQARRAAVHVKDIKFGPGLFNVASVTIHGVGRKRVHGSRAAASEKAQWT